jgi:pilus assembly protein CpaD
MTSSKQGSRVLCAARPCAALLAVLLTGTMVGGCWKQGPRFDAPFTLANAAERHPIKVSQGEATLDLAVYRGSRGLDRTQKGQLYGFLQEYSARGTTRLVVKAPTGGPNETAAMRAYDDVRGVMRQAGIDPRGVTLEPYFAGGDPYAPLRVSFLRFVAEGPDCPDWSENLARDPQNMPWPNKGCATQRNLAAVVANPEDLLYPRPETPRPSERRDVVWGKYVKGEPTGSKWSPEQLPLPERANVSEEVGE